MLPVMTGASGDEDSDDDGEISQASDESPDNCIPKGQYNELNKVLSNTLIALIV